MAALSRFLFLSLLLAVASATVAQARPGWGRGHDGGLLEEHADELGLDAETRAAIRDILSDSRESKQGMREELRGLHRQMKELLSKDAPDEGEVMELADRIGRLETARHKQRLATLLEIRAVLTPEQRAQLTELRRDERRRHRQPLADACREDVERLCSDAEGRFERMRCMRQHRDEVSDACREAFEDHPCDRPGKRSKRF